MRNMKQENIISYSFVVSVYQVTIIEKSFTAPWHKVELGSDTTEMLPPFVKTLSDYPTVAPRIGCLDCIAHYADAGELKTHNIEHHSDTLPVHSSQSTPQLTPQPIPPPKSPPSPLLPTSQMKETEHTDDIITNLLSSSQSSPSLSQSTRKGKRAPKRQSSSSLACELYPSHSRCQATIIIDWYLQILEHGLWFWRSHGARWEQQNMDGVLGRQVIGRDCLYIMHELATIQVHWMICQNWCWMYAGLALDVFSRICIPALRPPIPIHHTPRINPSIIDCVFSSTRACSLQYYH